MPYHVHNPEHPPGNDGYFASGGRMYATASEAGQSKQSGEVITFLASTDEINAWRDREYSRRCNGEYLPVPVFVECIEDRFPDHYVHLSLTRPGMLAYTKSVQHGIEDRQTIVRPGKYFTEYYADLGPDQIARYAGMISADRVTLSFARTPDEIETAYTASHGSCMYTGKSHLRDLPEQPVRAYGDSDLAVAYAGPIDNVTARCVVWPERKIYNRIYGHTSLLESLLHVNGFRQGRIEGARIRAIHYNGGFIVPYVDGVSAGTLSDDRKFILLDDSGPIDLHNTSGVADVEVHTCEHCGESCDEDQGLCDYCQDNTSSCDDCGNRYNDDDMTFEDGTGYCERCHSRRFATCDACHETIARNDARSVDGDDYCDDCYCDRFTCCDHCSTDVPCDDVRCSDATGEYYCGDCWSDNDRICQMADCETEWNEYDRYTSNERRDRKACHVDDLCDACAARYCHTCEGTHDPDDCPIVADAESDGFGVASWHPDATPWQRTLDFSDGPAIVQVPGLPIGYTCDWRHYGTIGKDSSDPTPRYNRPHDLLLIVNGLDGLAPRSWRHIFSDMQ